MKRHKLRQLWGRAPCRVRAVLVAAGWLCSFASLPAQGLPPPRPSDDEAVDEYFRPPTADDLFRADSEAALKERLRRADEARGVKSSFPAGAAFPPTPVVQRSSPPVVATYVTTQLCHRPLRFENDRVERYGHYVPYVQPVLSTGHFYARTALLPVSLALRPPWTWQCSPPEGARLGE